MRINKSPILDIAVAVLSSSTILFPAAATSQATSVKSPKFSNAVAFDVSPALRNLPATHRVSGLPSNFVQEIRPDRGPVAVDRGFSGDAAVQPQPGAAIPSTLANFARLSNQDNFNIIGFRVNPGEPNGAVGPNHYVEMINLVFGVYSKTGTLLLGPVDTGMLWAGFAVPDCTDPSGDPVVLYDQFMDRWLLSQFTTRGPTYYNCVAVSTTGDPTGSYYRYAFTTGVHFPDYPKYGVWTDSYVITTREFGPTTEYGIGVYALEKNKMINAQPARSVHFFIDGTNPALLPLVGDGLLPAYIDGKQKPMTDTAIPLVGTQDYV